jgi:hypothetical protein
MMRKTSKTGRYVPICVSVTPGRHGELRRLAKHHDTSVSAIVNAALDDLLATRGQAAVKERLDSAPLRKPWP